MNAAATTMLEIDDILAVPADILNNINSSLELNCTLRMSLDPSQVAADNKKEKIEIQYLLFGCCCTFRVTCHPN